MLLGQMLCPNPRHGNIHPPPIYVSVAARGLKPGPSLKHPLWLMGVRQERHGPQAELLEFLPSGQMSQNSRSETGA